MSVRLVFDYISTKIYSGVDKFCGVTIKNKYIYYFKIEVEVEGMRCGYLPKKFSTLLSDKKLGRCHSYLSMGCFERSSKLPLGKGI
jgi:hypothetical protein